MKQNIKYWVIIIIFTILPIALNAALIDQKSTSHLFIWALFLIPSILMMNMYPKWTIIIASAVFYSSLKMTTVFWQNPHIRKNEIVVLILGSVVNWSIHITIGYFIHKSHQLILLVEKLTLVDSLTGIHNRRYFDLFLEKTIPFIERNNHSLMMMTLDIDHFKKINDTYGHSCGDEALKHISQIIRENVRESDAYVRLGGEEFSVILPNTKLDEGKVVAERIRQAVEQSGFMYKHEYIHFTVSVGLSAYNGETVDEFIDKTDKALYQAKENGRNTVVMFR